MFHDALLFEGRLYQSVRQRDGLSLHAKGIGCQYHKFVPSHLSVPKFNDEKVTYPHVKFNNQILFKLVF